VEQLDFVQPQASAVKVRSSATKTPAMPFEVPDLPGNPYPACTTLDELGDAFVARVALIQQEVLAEALRHL
jgi:hypothetical protein